MKNTIFTRKLLIDDDKEPIDLSQKVLARIFINNSFGEGVDFTEDGGKTFQ